MNTALVQRIRVSGLDLAVAWVADRGLIGDEHDTARGVEHGELVLRVTDPGDPRARPGRDVHRLAKWVRRPPG
jgi:hypothetical protein